MSIKSKNDDGNTSTDADVAGHATSVRTTGRTSTTIGPTIQIHGDVLVTGQQAVHIEGRVEGTISLSDNILSVGKSGQVNATVNARAIFVAGTVTGDLKGDEQIVVQSSGIVCGNIVAPRVTLEDGCKFKGSIDMDMKPRAAPVAKPADDRSEKLPGRDDPGSGGRVRPSKKLEPTTS